MRPLLAAVAALLLVPTAAAEFGPEDDLGWPVAVDGAPTFPGGVLPTGALPEGPLNRIGPFTVYPYYPVLTAEMQRLATEHPDLVRLHSAGRSTLGLELWMLEIADFGNDEMLPLEEREVVWVDGGTHSNEYSGVWFAAHLASSLADGYGENETATWIVENRHTWIMPLVNPDGSHAFGRLNARGVNVNRNYPVDWGANAEDPVFNNPGPAPASEVETQHNIEWFNRTQPDLYVSVHCCGNLWLYPYGVEGLDPLDQQAFSRICDEAFAGVREFCGPIWSTIYPASGSSVDTVYEYTGAAAFGYEMSGRNAVALWGQPFTSVAVEQEESESWNGLMHGFLNVHRYGAYPNVTAAAYDGMTLTLRITNEGYGNLTNATVEGIPIPPLAPGASADIALARDLHPEPLNATIVYEKRHMAAPLGTRAISLVQGSTGLQLSSGELLGALATDDAARVPAPLATLLVALVGAALLLRRR